MTPQIGNRTRAGVIIAGGVGMSFGMPAMVLYTVGAFYDPIAAEIPMTRSAFGAGLLAMTVALAISVPLVGVLVDRFGVRRSVIAGALLLACSFASLAIFTRSTSSYIVGLAVVGILGACASPVGYTRAVTATFDRALGRALGIMLAIVGIFSAALPLIATRAVGEFGWRGGFLALGALALIPLPLSLVLLGPAGLTGTTVRKAEAEAEPEPDPGFDFLSDTKFWLMLVGFTSVAASMFGFMIHLIPFLRAVGRSASSAASYASLIGLSGLVSRVVIGSLCDFFQPKHVMFCSVIVAACALGLVAHEPELAALAAIALGFVVGAEVDLMSIIASRYYVGRIYGRVYAILYAPTIIGTGLSSLWIGRVADTQGYVAALTIGAVVGAIGGSLFLLLPPALRNRPASAGPMTIN